MNRTTELPPAADSALVAVLQQTETLLQEVQNAASDIGPTDTRIAERLAVRLLTRYYGWATVAPGVLVRPQQ